MFIKRLFLFSLISFISIGMVSCDETEEQTNDKFEFDYIHRVVDTNGIWNISSKNHVVVSEYYTYKDSNRLFIKGYTEQGDSLEMGMYNTEKLALTPGKYDMTSGLKLFSMRYYNKGNMTFSANGNAHISYVNSRINFDFYAYMNNSVGPDQFAIENGIADNLDLYHPHTDTVTVK